MKKQRIIFWCLFFLSSHFYAQNTFMKTFGGMGNEVARSVIETNDGNFLIAGYTSSYGNGGTDGYLLKIDSDGTEIWSRTIGGTGNEQLFEVIQLSNNDFVLTGWTQSFGSGQKDVLITRFDNNGNIIWSKTYGGFADEQAHTIIQTTDGNLLFSGWTASFGAGDWDVLLTKIDDNGNSIWSKTFGASGNDWVNGHGLIEDAQGNYVISGAWTSDVGIPFHNGFLLKVNTSGDVEFFKIYGGNKNDGFTGHLNEVNGRIQNIGISWSWNATNHEIWMSEFDDVGNISWSKSFGLANENIRIGEVFNTDDSNYLISAFEFTSNSTGNGLILKLDHSGNMLWSQSYGGNEVDRILTVLESNNNILAFGSTESYGQGGADILMLKTNNEGALVDCNSVVNLTTTNVVPSEVALTPSVNSNSLGQDIAPTILDVNFQESEICIPPPPIADFEILNDTICQGTCIDLLNYSQYAENWNWSFIGAGVDGADIFSPENICFPTVGMSTISLVVSNSIGFDTLSQTIFVQPVTTLDLDLGNDTMICNIESLSLDAAHPNALQYEWQDGSSSPTYDVLEGGEHQVTISNHCTAVSDKIFITINGCCDIYVPNAFSPNSNGVNDEFLVYYSTEKCVNVSSFSLKVFDRWGGEVFSSNNIEKGWDGTLKGKESNKGVYAWMISYFDGSQNNFKEGDVTLIR